MSKSNLSWRNVCGERARARARETRHGVLAHIMNQLIYGDDVIAQPCHSTDVTFYRTRNVQRAHIATDLYQLFGVTTKPSSDGKSYEAIVDVQKFLREVRDHLEFLSLQEVID